jgi:hypothetical protein
MSRVISSGMCNISIHMDRNIDITLKNGGHIENICYNGTITKGNMFKVPYDVQKEMESDEYDTILDIGFNGCIYQCVISDSFVFLWIDPKKGDLIVSGRKLKEPVLTIDGECQIRAEFQIQMQAEFKQLPIKPHNTKRPKPLKER